MEHLVVVLIFFTSTIEASNRPSPRFKWLENHKSPDGIPLLNIRFPDGAEDDTGILRRINSEEENDGNCTLEGKLLYEDNVTVTITGECPPSKNFKIAFNSNRLPYSNYIIDNGKVQPVPNELPGTQDEYVSFSSTKPVSTSIEYEFPQNGFSLKLRAFFDQSFRQKFEDVSGTIIRSIVDKAEAVFHLDSLTTTLKLEIVGIQPIYMSLTATTDDLEKASMINPKEENTNAFVYFADGQDQDDSDRKNGVAFKKQICSTDQRNRTAIIEWSENISTTAKTLAHEIGHLLGMEHDFLTQNGKTYKKRSRRGMKCTDINGVMDYGTEKEKWSACSVEDFSDSFGDEISKKGKYCLRTVPQLKGYSKVAVALGSSPNNLNDIEVIDLKSSNTKCQNLSNFPFKTVDAVGALGLEGKPIICGGEINSTSCHSLENDVWTSISPLREGRTQFAMTVLPSRSNGGKLFVTGGKDLVQLSTSEVLNETGWQPASMLPTKVHGHCMVLIDSIHVLLIGGFQPKSNKNYIFNSVSNTWSERQALLQPRAGHSCAMIKKGEQNQERDSVIVAGGWDLASVSTLYSSTEILDAASTAWRNGPKLPFGIYGAVMVEDPAGGVVLIGGSDSSFNPLHSIYKLAHGDASWEKMSQSLRLARDSHTAFLIPDKLANCTTVD